MAVPIRDRAGPRSGLFFIQIKASSNLARGFRGRFDTYQRHARAVNTELAAILASQIGERLDKTLVRPKARTGTLRAAVSRPDPPNTYADIDGFGVVRASEMDTRAPYWRIIEGLPGQEVWDKRVGRLMVGYWDHEGRPMPFIHGFPAGVPGGPGGRFMYAGKDVPRKHRAAWAREILEAAGFEHPAVFGRIQHGIKAEHFIRDAIRAFHEEQQFEDKLRELFDEADLPLRATGGGGG